MSVRRRLRGAALAATAALAVAIASVPADAVEAPAGSRNFTAPRGVPNYFSNESGPFQGGAGARPGLPGAVPNFAAPASRSRGFHAVSQRRYASRHAGRAPARGRVYAARGRAAGYHHVAFVGRRGHAAASRPQGRAGAAHRGSTHDGGKAHAGGKRLARAGR